MSKEHVKTVRTKKRKGWFADVLTKIKNDRQLHYYLATRLTFWGIVVILLGVLYYPTLELLLVAAGKIQLADLVKAKQEVKVVVKGNEILMDQSFRICMIGLGMIVMGFIFSIIEAMRRGKELVKSPPQYVIKVDLGKQLEGFVSRREFEAKFEKTKKAGK